MKFKPSFKPLSDRILVRLSMEPEKTAGGLYIPDESRQLQQEGEVVAVGKGRVTSDGVWQPMAIKVGDYVLFELYAGINRVKIDGEEFIIMTEDEVLGVLGVLGVLEKETDA